MKIVNFEDVVVEAQEKELGRVDHLVYFGHAEDFVNTSFIMFYGGQYDGMKIDKMDDGCLKFYGIKLDKEQLND